MLFAMLAALAAPAAAQNGALKVSSFPAGAAVSVDGIDTGRTTPASVSLPAGDHVITVSAGAGWQPVTRTVTIGTGRNDLAVTLVPLVTAGLPGPQGPQGATGPQGPAGPQGLQGPRGLQGDRGDKGDTGAAGAQGAKGDTGDKGDKGDSGAPGARGLQGAPGAPGATGPAGPPGPVAFVAPAPPPPAYAGTFFLEIDGGNAIPLRSFAGCFDKIIGVEFEDCYFSTIFNVDEVAQWLGQSVKGTGGRHDLRVIQVDLNFRTISVTEIANAFMSDFTVSDVEASDSGLAAIAFTVVPSNVVTTAGDNSALFSSSFPSSKRLLKSNFSMDITGINGNFIASVAGMHVAMPKVAAQPVGFARREFVPGAPVFDNLVVEMSAAGTTIQNVQSWFNQVSQGQSDVRTGELQFLSPSLATVLATVKFTDLSPVSLLPYGIGTSSVSRRPAVLSVGSFSVQ